MTPVDLLSLVSTLSTPWQAKTVSQYNGNTIMIAKAEGSYPWHKHEHTDDCFWVIKGQLTIEMRDTSVILEAGQMCVVPKGVEHRPVASETAYFLFIEAPDAEKNDTVFTPDPHQ